MHREAEIAARDLRIEVPVRIVQDLRSQRKGGREQGHGSTSANDPTETLLDRLEPVAFDGDEGFCDVSIPRPPTRRSAAPIGMSQSPARSAPSPIPHRQSVRPLPFAVHRS